MKLTSLTTEQKQHLKSNKEKFVKQFLEPRKICKTSAMDSIAFVYSLIKKPMPKIYEVSNPFQAQKLANKLKGTTKQFYSFGTYLTTYWASFYSYYETFVDFGIITEEKFPKYFELRKFIDSGIFLTIEFENAIIVCGNPSVCLKNENGLHNISGKAIQWADGYGQYYVNGRSIPKKYFLSISEKTFTMMDFINEKNEEHKSTCIALMQEKYGDEYIFDFFRTNLTEVDTYTDKKPGEFLIGTTGSMTVGVYTLFKGEINDQDIAYVRCYCPSTDRMFFLGVDSAHKKADDAIASLYRIPTKLKGHIETISRQGERFSTTFTEKGSEVLASLSEKEIANVSGLSGKDYFSLIKYEF